MRAEAPLPVLQHDRAAGAAGDNDDRTVEDGHGWSITHDEAIVMAKIGSVVIVIDEFGRFRIRVIIERKRWAGAPAVLVRIVNVDGGRPTTNEVQLSLEADTNAPATKIAASWAGNKSS